VKVLDFGMAKILTGPGADSQLSKLGIVPGTPSAMAPEQIYQLPPDPRIDIYATGILLYEMVVGQRPFTGADIASVVKMQVSVPPTPPREILGEQALSAELEQVIIKALEKDRLDRFGTAADMAAALRLTPEARALSTAPEARASSTEPVANELDASQRAPRRRTWLLLASVGALAALGALSAEQLLPLRWQSHAARAALIARETSREAVTSAPAQVPVPPPPPPSPVVEPWLAHRDLAVTYAGSGRHDDAFREVEAAIRDNPVAAAADEPLIQAAAGALSSERIAFVVESFRGNPRLIEVLATATATGPTAELRHAAYAALGGLGEQDRADTVAMSILDVEQATSCSPMRAAFKPLRTSKDPRVLELTAELRGRSRREHHVRCLRRLLRH